MKPKHFKDIDRGIMISACVIVKNEEKNLPRWLECARDLADEMIVVDTGSTDRTVELAKAAGAKVYNFPWIGDFAAAKNFTLDKAKGNWIVFLDADEYISAEDRPRVREAIVREHHRPDILGFVAQVVNIDQDNHGASLDRHSQIRIFRKLPTLRFFGKVHEFLRNTDTKSPRHMQGEEGFKIYHTGYSSTIVRQKLERNLKILLERADAEKDTLYYGYLMDCYYGLADYEKALAAAEKSIELGRGGDRDNRTFAVRMECLGHLGRSEEEILAALQEAETAYPGRPEFKAVLANYYWNRGEFVKAEATLKETLALCETIRQRERSAEDYLVSNVTGKVESMAQGKLGILAALQGAGERAVSLLLASLRAEPYEAACLMSLLNLLRGNPPVEIISLLNGIYDKGEDAPWLIPLLAEAGLEQEALYYDRQSDKSPLTDFERYFLSRRFDAAAAWLTEDMNSRLALGDALKETYNLPTGALDLLRPPGQDARRQRATKRLKTWLEKG